MGSETSDRVVRIGVLGAGTWAQAAHLPGYRRGPRCRIVAIADPNLALAREAARRFEIPTATGDHRELLQPDDIGVIDVCTPRHTHFELAWAALEAGKHVLCEKPVAYDFRDTRRAAALAKSKGGSKPMATTRYRSADTRIQRRWRRAA